MRMRMRAVTATLSLAAFLALGGCYDAEPEVEMEGGTEAGEVEEDVPTTGAETEMGFGSWDTDADTYLTRGEWDVWWSDADRGAPYDTDDADGLSRDEWATTTYGLWDVDDDRALTETEWTEGTDRWYGDEVDHGSWADWDLDGDSELDANEVAEGLERESLYDHTDLDDDLLIDDEELADWFFDVFDFDDDERIDTTEWDWGANNDFAS